MSHWSPTPPDQDERVVRIAELKRRVQLSKTTVYAMVKEGNFPEPIRLGQKSVGWLESELRAWLASRAAARQTVNA